MRSAFYLLILICLAMCGLASIATWLSCGITSAAVLFAALLNALAPRYRRLKRFKLSLSALLTATTLIALIAEEWHVGRGDYDSWLLRFTIDLIFLLFTWRACSHDSRPKRMQVVILSMLPLAAMAYTLEAVTYFLCLFSYGITFLACLSIEAFSAPNAGAVAEIARSADREKVPQRRDFNIPGFAKQFVVTLAVVFLMSFTAFFLLPRHEQNVAFVSTASKSQSNAISDIDLNQTGDIELDQTLVFTSNIPKTGQPHYWRLDVQDAFDGVKWTSAAAQEMPAHYRQKSDRWFRVEFTQSWKDKRLPTLPGTLQIKRLDDDSEQSVRFFQNANSLWLQWGYRRAAAEGFQFALPQNAPDNFVLKAVTTHGRTRHVWPDITPLLNLALGRDPNTRVVYRDRIYYNPSLIWPKNERDPYFAAIRDHALKITRDYDDNLEKAAAISAYLQANYQYSLSRPERLLPVVVDFLFNQKFGHCELFSTTMVVLLNSLRIPARNVSGFMSSEYHDGLNYVRALNAHSWVEVYDENTDTWVRFDPTPPGGAVNSDVSLFTRFNDWFLTYKSKELYAWIPKHSRDIALFLLMLLTAISTYFAVLRWLRIKLISAVISASVIGLALFVVVIISGPVPLLIALALCTAAATFACYRASQTPVNELWHSAIKRFREEIGSSQPELAQASLEFLWERARSGRLDDVDAFFKAAIIALYSCPQPNNLSFPKKFRVVRNIRTLLLRALSQLRKS